MKNTEKFILSEISQPQEARRKAPGALLVLATFLLSVLLILLVVGLVPRLAREKELDAAQEKVAELEKQPIVSVTLVKGASSKQEVTLPANIDPIQEIPIYARSSGYLKERLVDIGDRVATNQLLMSIATPETDKQLQQAVADRRQAESALNAARADLAQSVSSVENAKASVKKIVADLIYSKAQVQRYAELSAQGAVSLEQRDLAQHNVDSDKASLEASEAAVRTGESQVTAFKERLAAAKSNVDSKTASVEQFQQLVGFQRVLAPCAGVITSRNVDAGALVTAGSTGQNTELLRMARTDVLRVFIFVPQSFFQSVHVGDTANILVSELPSRTFKGTIVHVAGGLDPQSRTLQAEVRIPNKEGILMPGMYAQVQLISDRAHVPVLVPSNAIIVRSDGTYIAEIDSGSHLHYRKVLLGRDFGPQLEVSTGLSSSAKVALDLADDLPEGQLVSTRCRDKE